jgi:hypothetical protein
MATLHASSAPVPLAPPAAASPDLALRRRGVLVLACALTTGAAALLAEPSAAILADPELARLLRGMAVIKAVLVAGGLGVLWWRLGRPVSQGAAVVYVGGAALLTGATLLIWQLSHLIAAPVIFHAATLALVVVAANEERLWERLRGRRLRP